MLVILMAVVLLAALLTIAVGATTLQNANAVITFKENCHHSDEQCMMNDLKRTLQNMMKGLMADDNN
jgi:Spy/CpxP family protein refolding chaperone